MFGFNPRFVGVLSDGIFKTKIPRLALPDKGDKMELPYLIRKDLDFCPYLIGGVLLVSELSATQKPPLNFLYTPDNPTNLAHFQSILSACVAMTYEV